MARFALVRRIGFAVVGFGLGPLLLLDGLTEIGPAFNAARGDGSPGTFVLEKESCSKNGCRWLGVFTPADGSAARRDMRHVGDLPAGHGIGTRVAAVDTGDDDSVFTPAGPWWMWGQQLNTLFWGVALLVMGLHQIVHRQDPSPGRSWRETGD